MTTVNTLDNKILSICMSVVTPLILIFGFYIQFHGEVSPGGGFQSGIIFTIPCIVYILLYGNTTKPGYYMIESSFFKNIGFFGVLLYVFTGIISNILGGNCFEYNVFNKDNKIAQQIGIFWVETGVCIAVFGGMSTIFLALYKYILNNNSNT